MARIMIVDDSAVMRMNLRKILTEAGHTVIAEAQNGKVACTMYERHQPDLVTMDITMPVMSGVDATGAIISQFPEARIIMISALNQKKMVFDALKNGAKHYIIKPIDKTKVLSIVDEVLLETGEEVSKKETQSAEVPSKDKPKENHFLIENLNGTFFVRFFDGFDDDDMEKLATAMQGVLFIKPLTIRYDFGDLSYFADQHLNQLMTYAKQVLDDGGDYDALVASDELRRLLDSKEEMYLR